MNPRGIAILHYTAPPIVGGVEQVLSEHARLFVAAGYPTRIVVGRGGTEGLPPGAEVVVIPEIDSEHPENLAIAAALDRGEVPAEFGALRDRIAQALDTALQGCDVVIAHNVMTMHFNLPLTAALWQLLDARKLGAFVAWTHDGSWEDPLQQPHVRPGYPWDLLRRYRRDASYVVVSHARQVSFARMFGVPQNRLRVIPNGVHVHFWWNLSAEGDDLIMSLGLLDGDLFVLQPTRITLLKNIGFSLEVVAALKALGRNPRFVVTGPPDPHDAEVQKLPVELRRRREELGLEESEALFLFEHGAVDGRPRLVPQPVLRDLYAASDVVLLPSTAEGFGIPVVEAGLLGRPVFCSDIDPFREIGGDLLHRFRLTESPTVVAARIAAWAERDRAYKLRRRVWRQYTWRAIMRQHLVPLLDRLAEPSAGGAVPLAAGMMRGAAE